MPAAGEAGAPPGLFALIAGEVGAAAIDLFETARGIYSVFVRALYYVFYGRREPGLLSHYMYEIGNRSLFFVSIVMAFFGGIVVYQAGIQAQRVVPDLTMLGAMFIELLVRDLAASIAALMLATRVGSGIAAEIGAMVVTEQIDALRMSGTDPIDYLIRPRMIASIIMCTAVIIVGGLVACGAGVLVAQSYFDVAPRTFLNLSLVDFGDLAVGLIKCLAYGTAIPIVSGYCGLTTFGGSEGVGWATTRAVVASSLSTILLNFFISGAGVFVFPALSLGGSQAMKRFEGKAVLVTGAGSGIGRAVARRLSSEGARVLIADVNIDGAEKTAADIRAEGGEAIAARCDVSDPAQAKATVAQAVSAFGRLDVLASCAGIGGFKRTLDVSFEDWSRMIAVNLTGSFLMSQAALPHVIATKGAIVFVASIAGLKSHPYSAAYCASKGGVVQLTKALAVEYARKEVRINCVCPGGVETPMLGQFQLPEGGSQRQLMRIAPIMDRYASPDEVASAIAYLASPEASYVNGAALVVDGAMSA